MEVEIRPAVADEHDALRDFGERVVVPYYNSLGLGDFGRQLIVDYWSDADIAGSIAEARALVALDLTGSIVGLAVYDRYEDEPVIWQLYVETDLRGTGIGRQMVEAVEARLPAADTSILIEHASENERAASAYDGLGFAVAWIDEGDGPGATTVWRRRLIGRTSA